MQVFVNSTSFKIVQFTVKLLKEQKQGLKSLDSTHHHFCCI